MSEQRDLQLGLVLGEVQQKRVSVAGPPCLPCRNAAQFMPKALAS